MSGLYHTYSSRSKAQKSLRSELASPPTTIIYFPSKQEAWYVLALGIGEFYLS